MKKMLGSIFIHLTKKHTNLKNLNEENYNNSFYTITNITMLSKDIFLRDYLWDNYKSKYKDIVKDQEKMSDLLLALIPWLQSSWENERRVIQVFEDVMLDYFKANWQGKIAEWFLKAYLNIFD